MDIKILPSKFKGFVYIPSSKSYSHRAIISASLCNGVSIIKNISFSEDIKATINCMKQMGVQFYKNNNNLYIKGPIKTNKSIIKLDCKESASTLRFLIPITIALKINTIFTGSINLMKRTIQPYITSFKQHDIHFKLIDDTSFKFVGKFKQDKNIEIDCSKSSQFLTGLLFSITISKIKNIIVKNELVSIPYFNITKDLFLKFGVEIINKNNKYFRIKKRRSDFKKNSMLIEGDFSSACFIICLAMKYNKITIKNLNNNSIQGDKIILNILDRLGYICKFNQDYLQIKKYKKINYNHIVFDGKNYPDIIPILSVLFSVSPIEKLTIKNISRLRGKESDRINSTKEMLINFGYECHTNNNSIEILKNKNNIKNKKMIIINSFNDHRIVMSATILSYLTEIPCIIKNYEHFKKSYPLFFKHIKDIGGKYIVLNME
ncbi:MAG: hypothetical protein KFW09_03720 [Oscillospiraceae bacterium]|nr:hypothetical protein [Oscillospiraceae bacterium]